MTAEIAIMNKSGIALAADSTSGSRCGGGHLGVRKLFKLSDHHPVAAMVFNNPCFAGVFWGESVIPAFVRKTGQHSYPTIRAWTDAFADFVRKYGTISREQARRNVGTFVDSLMRDLEYEVAECIGPYGAMRGMSANAARAELIDIKISIDRLWPRVLGKDEVAIVRTLGAAAIRKACELPWVKDDRALQKKVRKLITGFIAGSDESETCSGIVIAGYGSHQSAPALCELQIEAHFGPVVKMHVARDIDMANEPHALILPFAMRDMVDKFTNGMDEKLKGFIRDALNTELVDALTELAPGEKDIDKYCEVAHLIGERFEHRLAGFCSQAYTQDIVSYVHHMPPHDLPKLAQELVRLSAVSHAYSSLAPQVGEPIDAALMTSANPVVDLRGAVKPDTVWRMAS